MKFRLTRGRSIRRGKNDGEVNENQSSEIAKNIYAKEAFEKWPWKKTNASISDLTAGGGNCKMCAEKIREAIGGDIIHIVDKFGAKYIGEVYNKSGKLISSLFQEHYAVRKGDFIFDRITGPDGMHISKYKELFQYGDYLTF